MSLFKRIILFIQKLFKILFGKRKVTKKIKTGINNTRNKHYLKGYGVFLEESYNETLPVYLMISEEDKKKLINKVIRIEEQLIYIEDVQKDVFINTIDAIERKMENTNISFYEKEKIDELLDTFLFDKEINVDTKKKVTVLENSINKILENFDDIIKDRVKKEYEQVNFVTISTLFLDETLEQINVLNDDYKHHKYNKNYYNRELNRINNRINNLKKLYDSISIREELIELRKNLYTKSKDKYDLLYNDEILLNINNQCDELLSKVNKKIIDLKKDNIKEVLKKEDIKEDKKQELEYLNNIIKRFKDLELAHKLLMFKNYQEMDISNAGSLIDTLNKCYYDFINGEKVIFNFERNKMKTELVSFYNNLNKINSLLTKEEYVFIDHINYRMDDLIEATINKKEELECIIENKYQYKSKNYEESILVDNKLHLLKEREEQKEKPKVLTKKSLQGKEDNEKAV